MKRNVDLIRWILQRLEDTRPDASWSGRDLEKFPQEEVSYHIKLLYEAEMIDAEPIKENGSVTWKATGLRWKGHEFLDVARDKETWKMAKNEVREKGITPSAELLFELLRAKTRERIGIR